MSSSEEKIPVNDPPHYAEEVLCASWNPLALFLAEPLAQTRSPAFAGGDVESDVASFLDRLYRCQQA